MFAWESYCSSIGRGIPPRAPKKLRREPAGCRDSRRTPLGQGTGLQFFRPQPPGSVEADQLIAEGNVITGSRAAVAWVNIDGGAEFRTNFVYRPTRWVGRMLKETNEPGFVDTQDGSFTDNVIVWHEGDLSRAFNDDSPNTMPETFTFDGNQWYNATQPGNSTPTLPAAETGGTYGVDPGLSIDDVAPWSFDWGLWLVNANDNTNVFNVGDPNDFRLAVAGGDATLDLDQAFPFIGDWTFEELSSAEITATPFSQTLLADAALVPEPAASWLALAALAPLFVVATLARAWHHRSSRDGSDSRIQLRHKATPITSGKLESGTTGIR